MHWSSIVASSMATARPAAQNWPLEKCFFFEKWKSKAPKLTSSACPRMWAAPRQGETRTGNTCGDGQEVVEKRTADGGQPLVDGEEEGNSCAIPVVVLADAGEQQQVDQQQKHLT
jgi:hypothetical protein